MTVEKRESAYRRGRWAEGLCCLVLLFKGYRILARDYRTKVGEIDIVARRGATIAFVEVKARNSLRDAAEAIGARQKRRIARAASGFLAQSPIHADLIARFDVMLVAPWRWPRHIENAWQLDDRAPF